ncbi:TIGR03751 family conjugal transfer lipoprotein [Comamonadaceae bacterium OH2545_COT-014]|nr:TIGR03751 family conjugal transfer lipoprotein [Comamonadaceae bacterium OH2545_COT-014]
MAWNESPRIRRARPTRNLHALATATAFAAFCLAGCSVTGERESPINEVTRGSPTVLDIYRGQAGGDQQAGPAGHGQSAQERLRRNSLARPVAAGDGRTRRYWSALEPLQQRFARVPNPDLVMVVYPHLARGRYPVPGYVTVFPMYEQTHYALPGEVAEDLIEGRALYQPARAGAAAARPAREAGAQGRQARRAAAGGQAPQDIYAN